MREYDDPVVSNGLELQGFVYLVKCGEYYKLGRTKFLGSRLTSFRVNNPFEIILIKAVKVENCFALEAELLAENSKFLHKGEWFNKNLPIKKIIKTLQSYGE